MKKFSDQKIALVALIAIAAWIFVALPLLYLPNEALTHGEFLNIKFGEWLLSAATVGLWWATWRLVKGVEQTAGRQLRAYVPIIQKGFDVAPAATAGTIDIRANFIVKNNGQTPA